MANTTAALSRFDSNICSLNISLGDSIDLLSVKLMQKNNQFNISQVSYAFLSWLPWCIFTDLRNEYWPYSFTCWVYVISCLLKKSSQFNHSSVKGVCLKICLVYSVDNFNIKVTHMNYKSHFSIISWICNKSSNYLHHN